MAFTHILLPTDFSEPANRALHYALEEKPPAITPRSRSSMSCRRTGAPTSTLLQGGQVHGRILSQPSRGA